MKSTSNQSDKTGAALKDLYNQDLLDRMATSIYKVYPQFDAKRFKGLMKSLKPLEMKDRVRYLRGELHSQLPKNFPKALEVLMRSLKSKKITGFDLWPYTEFIQTYGLEHPDLSLKALKEMTKVFTSEWAVRPFLIHHPKQTLSFLDRCCHDPHESVRRWASEGSRPRLPWGERLQAFIKDPTPDIKLLEALKFDSSLFVRTSVANHLNDITKDHPELVLGTLKRWRKEATGAQTKHVDWIIRKALRTLIKDGHPEALGLIGATKGAKIIVPELKLSHKKIKMGDRLTFSFSIIADPAFNSRKNQNLVVDYVVHFRKANNKTIPKVFKLKTIKLPAGNSVLVEKTHHFKNITTRVYYKGVHSIAIQVNGVVYLQKDFHLEA